MMSATGDPNEPHIPIPDTYRTQLPRPLPHPLPQTQVVVNEPTSILAHAHKHSHEHTCICNSVLACMSVLVLVLVVVIGLSTPAVRFFCGRLGLLARPHAARPLIHFCSFSSWQTSSLHNKHKLRVHWHLTRSSTHSVALHGGHPHCFCCCFLMLLLLLLLLLVVSDIVFDVSYDEIYVHS